MSPPPVETAHELREQSETTPRNSATPDDESWGPMPPAVQLKSELARGAEREVELMSSLLLLILSSSLSRAFRKVVLCGQVRVLQDNRDNSDNQVILFRGLHGC